MKREGQDPKYQLSKLNYSELCLFSFIIGSRISPTFCLCDQILTYEERLSVSTSRVLYKTLLTMGFPRGSVVKNPPANAGDVSSIPGSGRATGEGSCHFSISYSGVPTPVFLPGKSHRQGNLACYNPWGRKKSRT